MCRVLPVQHVADWYRLDWDTIKALDKAALSARLLPVDLSSVRIIAMDKFALRKGHRYATVVLEPHAQAGPLGGTRTQAEGRAAVLRAARG